MDDAEMNFASSFFFDIHGTYKLLFLAEITNATFESESSIVESIL